MFLGRSLDDLCMWSQTYFSLHPRTQPLCPCRAYSALVHLVSCFVGETTKHEWEGDQPVEPRRTNIAWWIEDMFSRACAVIQLAINPYNGSTRNYLHGCTG